MNGSTKNDSKNNKETFQMKFQIKVDEKELYNNKGIVGSFVSKKKANESTRERTIWWL